MENPSALTWPRPFQSANAARTVEQRSRARRCNGLAACVTATLDSFGAAAAVLWAASAEKTTRKDCATALSIVRTDGLPATARDCDAAIRGLRTRAKVLARKREDYARREARREAARREDAASSEARPAPAQAPLAPPPSGVPEHKAPPSESSSSDDEAAEEEASAYFHRVDIP